MLVFVFHCILFVFDCFVRGLCSLSSRTAKVPSSHSSTLVGNMFETTTDSERSRSDSHSESGGNHNVGASIVTNTNRKCWHPQTRPPQHQPLLPRFRCRTTNRVNCPGQQPEMLPHQFCQAKQHTQERLDKPSSVPALSQLDRPLVGVQTYDLSADTNHGSPNSEPIHKHLSETRVKSGCLNLNGKIAILLTITLDENMAVLITRNYHIIILKSVVCKR